MKTNRGQNFYNSSCWLKYFCRREELPQPRKKKNPETSSDNGVPSRVFNLFWVIPKGYFCLSRIEACHYRTNETLLELPIYIDVYRNSKAGGGCWKGSNSLSSVTHRWRPHVGFVLFPSSVESKDSIRFVTWQLVINVSCKRLLPTRLSLHYPSCSNCLAIDQS